MPASLNKYLDPAALDETVVKIRELIEGLEAEMQDLPYARPDGLYPDMTVGSVIGADETAQWAQRESAGSGAATVRSVQGAAVGWNQMAPALTASNYTAYEFLDTSFSEGVFTGTINNTTTTLFHNVVYTAGHKYMLLADVKAPANASIALAFVYAGSIISSKTIVGIGDFERNAVWYTTSSGPSGDNDRIVLRNFVADNVGSEVSIKNIQLFDLTQMFGAGNEPTTVAEFERMYPEPYYPYSAPTLKPVQIAGISSTDAQGAALDSVEIPVSTYFPDGMWGFGEYADALYADRAENNVGKTVLAIGDGVTFSATETPNAAGLYSHTLQYSSNAWVANGLDRVQTIGSGSYFARNKVYSTLGVSEATSFAGSTSAGIQGVAQTRRFYVRWPSLLTEQECAQLLDGANGVFLYELATPTTTPISPAMSMTYRVQAGGSENIIVPSGEVSAAPLLTVAEPVNAGDEFARIWAAIESLGYTRNTAQLSRPVSLTDIGSIDEVQKDTTEIDTTKEVTE